MYDFLNDPRFAGIEPFKNKIWLSSPTMHGEEQYWVNEAIRTNWVSTVGENINEIERMVAEMVGRNHAVALSCGTAALPVVKSSTASLRPDTERWKGTRCSRQI